MFTGIIQHVGAVRAARAVGDGRRLTIDLGPLAEGLAAGDSVAVDGACLTACRIAAALADFDLAAETVARTTLGAAHAGTKVNLERALRVGSALDGHLVQGHVDGTAEIARIDRRPDQWTVEFAAPPALTDEMVEKGSVAVNGVSLTLTSVGAGTFAVALIPTTWTHTTFADLTAGAKVNVETDIIGKYVRRYLRQLSGQPAPPAAPPPAPGGGLTIEKLRQAGFI
jgi:riboflavin synthase